MRNFSMKKFGTPMRAGPGSASETVGLSSVGVPSVLRVGLDSSTCFSTCSTRFSSLPVSDSELGERARRLCAGSSLPPRLSPPPRFPRAGASAPSPGGSVGAGVGVGVRVGAGAAGVAVAVGEGVAVATGPRSTIDCTGAGRPGISIDRRGCRAGRRR